MRRRKLRVGLATVGTVLAVQALALIPAAVADTCAVSVTLVTGQHLSFTVNVAPGTPVSALNLPVPGPIASVSESCSAPPPPATTTTTTGSSTSSSSNSSSSSSSSSTSSTSTHTKTT